MTKEDKYVLATDDDFIQLKPVPHKIYDETNKEEFFMNWDNTPSAFDVANQTRKRKNWVKEAEWVGGQPEHGDKIKEIEVIYENGDSDVLEVGVYISSAASREVGLKKFVEGSGFRMVMADDEDFVEDNARWVYKGEATEVEIPHKINGELVTAHNIMFNKNFGASPVTKVKSTNPYVTNMNSMFSNTNVSETLDLSELDTSGVTSMNNMFSRSTIHVLDLSSFDTSNVTTMASMFYESTFSELDLSSFDTSNVTNMDYMFERTSTKNIILNSFDTSNVTNMRSMFSNTTQIQELDLSSFDTSSMSSSLWTYMFSGTTATRIYARTQRDADFFSTRSSLPSYTEVIIGGKGYIPPKPPREPISTYETTEELPVPFQTEEIDDKYLAEGLTEVFQEGEDGLKEITYLITVYDDGSETQEILKEETITSPIPRIVYIGTAAYESLEEVEREEVIPFFTEYVDDDSLYVGEEEVKHEGEDGLVRLLVRITTLFDGTIQEEIIEEEILKEAIPQLIHRGTKLEEDTRIEYEYIDYETEYIESDRLTEGREQVIQSGKRGEIRYVYAIKTLDSGEIEEELISEQRTEPINRIIYVGTRKAKHWVTEVYLLNEVRDREYFVDKSREGATGLSEEFGITLRERPTIPTAQMRHNRSTVTGRLGDIAAEDNYDNVEISLHFNYIDEGNARETYNRVANALSKMEAGITRLRFSDDKDGSFRVLAERPSIQELNNDLLNWGDFVVRLTLKPFRYIEQEEVELTRNVDYNLKQPLKNAQRTAQRVQHQTEKNVDITMTKNNKRIYTVADATTEVVITDATLLSTYGGDIE